MTHLSASELKDRAFDLMQVKLSEVAGTLNDEHENLVFYVKDNGIWFDCSDYSPRDVCIFKM